MKKSIVNGESRGSVNEILLKALQSGDKYGYEINKEIEVKSKGKYFIKEASLYSGLKRLESAGFITSYWKIGNLGIRRHYYSISEKGLEKLNNSNFSWDNSKEELMSDLFKDKKSENLAETSNSKQIEMNLGAENSNLKTNSESSQEIQKPTNPFAYVVSENQQDMFSLFNSKVDNINQNVENKVDNQNVEKTDDNNSNKIENLNENQSNENIKTENAINSDVSMENAKNVALDENKDILSDKIKLETNEEINQQANFDELKKEVQFKNSYINKKASKNNINIFDYIQNSEQNASIVFENNSKKEEVETHPTLNSENIQNNKTNYNQNVLNQNSNFENNSYSQNTNNQTNIQNPYSTQNKFENYNQNTNQNAQNSSYNESFYSENNSRNSGENSEKIKDIFKNLMVEDVEQKIDEDEVEIEKVEEVKQVEQKPELPRIKLDNDVNMTLQTGKSSNYSKQYSNSYTPSQISGKNTPSVKQYLSKAKTLNLSNKNIEEDISLHGFKIREYSKMNSRSYKTSNYYYPNILNLVLISIIGGICLLESILGLVYANNSVFAVSLFTLALALSLIFIGFAIIKYDKDKFKVEIKNYNFKTSLFYFVMIFIVLTIILVCVNILRGMNLSNFTSFARILIFEIVISCNLVLYPIVKLMLFRCGKFNN